MTRGLLAFLFVLVLVSGFVFLSSVELVVACNPSDPFSFCYESSESHGSASAYAKVSSTSIWSYSADGKRYYDSNDAWTVRCDGDRAWLYDYNVVSAAEIINSCDRYSCQASGISLPVRQDVVVGVEDYLPMRPAVYCYSNDERSDGSWAWTVQGFGWSHTYHNIVRDCSVNSDCGSNQYCNVVNSYERVCEQLVCEGEEVVRDHQCVSVEVPDLCQEEGISDLAECQDYLNTYLAIIEGDLSDKVAVINSLELELADKQQFIFDLEASVAEKAFVINSLELTLEEQADTIQQLTVLREEQAAYIQELTLNVEEQAALINSLTANLAEKAFLVSQLSAENERQAELIAEMEVSFENQGAILDALGKELADDARIIGLLSDKVDDQARILSGMQRTVEEQQSLIAVLRLSLEDEERLTAELSGLVSEQRVLIERLRGEQERFAGFVVVLLVSLFSFLLVFSWLWWSGRVRFWRGR